MMVQLFPSEASLLGLQMVVFFLSPHMVSQVNIYVLITPSYKDTSQIRLGPTHMTPFYLFEDPVSKYSCILTCSGLRLPHKNFARTQFSPK